MDFEPLDDEAIDNIETSALTELHNYQKSLEEEFKTSRDDTPDEIKTKAREWAIEHLPMALQRIAVLAEKAEKDSTQLAACKTIWAIASATSTDDGKHPLEDLFKQLEKKADGPTES
jgi:ribosomal protein RSM22 (predicted rRNA methylase)